MTAALVLSLLLSINPELPADCATIALEAVVAPDLTQISGTWSCEVDQGGLLWTANYPNALATDGGLDDVNSHWHYPKGFEPTTLHYDAVPKIRRGQDRWTAWGPVQVGERITLPFTTRIPRRNGLLGRTVRELRALAGWQPVLGDGTSLRARAIRYNITTPQGLVGFVGTKPIKHGGESRGVYTGASLPIYLVPRARISHVGTEGVWVQGTPFRPDGSPKDLTSNWKKSADTQFQTALTRAARTWTQAGLTWHPMLFVEGELRERLIAHFELGLMVSDRAFRVIPFNVAERFHRERLYRAIGSYQTRRIRKSHQRDDDAHTVADEIGGLVFRDLMRDAEGSRSVYAPELLRRFAVIPEIDSLVMAPQTVFRDTYYDALNEDDPHHNQWETFYRPYRRGKLVYEKWQDAFGFAPIAAMMHDYWTTPQTFEQSVKSHLGQSGWEVLEYWSTILPELDYGLGSVTTHNGEVSVVIEAAPSPEDHPPHQPIVLDVETGGNRRRFVVSKPGSVRLPFHDVGRLILDPERRLLEVNKRPGWTARHNNESPQPWRFLLNNISGLVAATNQQVSLLADFTLRQVYNVRWRYNFFAAVSPNAVSGSAGVAYSFGSELNPLRLTQRVSLGVSAQRLQEQAALTDDLRRPSLGADGIQGSISAGYSYDTRLSPFTSFRGEGLRANAFASHASNDANERFLYGGVSVSVLKLFMLNTNQALAFRARGDQLVGVAPAQGRLSLGGRSLGSRGFEGDELRGSTRATFTFEHRHNLVVNTSSDPGGFLTLSRIEGAFFSDAVFMPNERADCSGDWFYAVGYGARFLVDVLALSPSMLAVDVGAPFNRCGREADRARFAVYLSFRQSLSSF